MQYTNSYGYPVSPVWLHEENTKEKQVKHFLVVYILHKKFTSVSKLMSP